jgi:hypothetical protein
MADTVAARLVRRSKFKDIVERITLQAGTRLDYDITYKS